MLARNPAVQLQTYRPRRVSDFSAPQIAVLLILFTVLTSIPIITHPLPPIEDYVNHLARMHVMSVIGQDASLARFYEIDWQIVPNLMMDMIVPPLVRFVNVYAAGQIFTVMVFVLILSGMMAVHRVLFGRWSALPLIACPLLYNYVFLVGVMNYMFGVGLALWGFAAWLGLRERSLPLRLVVSLVFVIALFFCHLYALGIYGMGVLAAQTWRLWDKRHTTIRARLADFFAAGLPFLAVIPLLLKSPTLGLWQYEWEPRGKTEGLIWVIQVYSDIVAFAVVASITGAMIWAVRRRLFRFHPVGWPLLLISAAVYLAMPRTLFEVNMADQRLPIAATFMTIACMHVELRHRLVRRGFLALALAVLMLRVTEVDFAWAQLSPLTLEFRNSVKRIKPGSRILVAYADPSGGDDVVDLGLVHAACLAMIERSALVATAFTVPGKQIMHVRPDYMDQVDVEDGQPPTVEQIVEAAAPESDVTGYWRSWQDRFDYVYILFTDDEARNPLPQQLKPVYDGGRFQLYRVIKPNSAEAAASGGGAQ
jgi:hypothetical protein